MVEIYRVEIYERKTRFEGIFGRFRPLDEFIAETMGKRLTAERRISKEEAQTIQKEVEGTNPGQIVVYFRE